MLFDQFLFFGFLVLGVLRVLGKWLLINGIWVLLSVLFPLDFDLLLGLLGIVTGVGETGHHEEGEDGDSDADADLGGGV